MDGRTEGEGEGEGRRDGGLGSIYILDVTNWPLHATLDPRREGWSGPQPARFRTGLPRRQKSPRHHRPAKAPQQRHHRPRGTC